jgi:hypothetical protein
MVNYHIIRVVVPGTPCSYPAGKAMHLSGFRTEKDAQDIAEVWNHHVYISGITYIVEPLEENEQSPYPLFL